jgi:anhydro-N-acetylmuramic acid kinase
MNDRNCMGVIGLMSGTSLDGLDICYAEFSKDLNGYQYRNLIAKTLPYQDEFKSRLKDAFFLNQQELQDLSKFYGQFLGKEVKRFIEANQLNGKAELIASHGHTIFHQPEKKITVQIGCGNEIYKATQIKTITNFRITDVLLGGQGAPLVPVGDHYLFSDYEACLNLGGISNISFISEGERIAFDISPCNLPINYLAKKYLNLDFDHSGQLASRGNVIPELSEKLNDLPFYKAAPPKSLGLEWLIQEFYPILEAAKEHNSADLIRTVTDHIAFQINQVLEKFKIKNVLVTGGGAYNTHLINQLQNGPSKIILPPSEIIEFKEALIFGFLGYLNFNDSINTFKSVTGALKDSTGGERFFGIQQ